jgi:hypothetical protein
VTALDFVTKKTNKELNYLTICCFCVVDSRPKQTPTTWNPDNDPFLSELERVLDEAAKRKKSRSLEWIRDHFNHSQPSARRLKRVLKSQASYGLMKKYEEVITFSA